MMHGHSFETAAVCALTMDLGFRTQVGITPEGLRMLGCIAGGTVAGPRISGRILDGAADWAVMRHDGVLLPEVKLLVQTEDGAKIQFTYEGVLDMGADSYEGMTKGKRSGDQFHPRTAVTMITSAPAYEWVNRRQFIGVGMVDYSIGNGRITYDIYELTIPAQ